MADQDKIDTRYNYFWIHNVFGHFVKDTMDYFAEYLYPRFSPWKVIGTFDKAVEWINKTTEMGREADQPQRPGLILDPSGDFAFDETAGKMQYRFPNLSPGFAKYVYQPIYQDEQVLITVAFARVVGDFNFLALMTSFYEYTDMRVFLNLIFGGLERFIYPNYFNSFIILPSEIYNYEYNNDITGMHYKIDIDRAYSQLVRTTNTDEVVYPCVIKPRFKLSNMSDSSTKLGGADNLPDWRLGFTLSYELEMPTYIILESDYFAKQMQVNINYGSCYTSNKNYTGVNMPANYDYIESNVDIGLDSTANSSITWSQEAEVKRKYREFKIRYYHVTTKQESDSTAVIMISLPHPISDPQLVILNGKSGPLTFGDHYTFVDNGNSIGIDKQHVVLAEGDILEIFIYAYT